MVQTTNVRAIAHTQYVTIFLVETDPIFRFVRAGSFTAFEPPVDDVGGDTVPGRPPRGRIRRRRLPPPGDHVVARRLLPLRRHPEPYRGLKRDYGVGRDQVRIVHQIFSDGLARQIVVVLAETLVSIVIRYINRMFLQICKIAR